MPGNAAVQYVHNPACETAAQASCHCACHGAGHQNDFVVRAAGCPTTADHTALANNLEDVFGGFHASFRDVTTPTRGARNVLSVTDAATLGHDVLKGATWFETLIVDEGLHAMFLQVADASLLVSPAERRERTNFVQRITTGAIGIVRSSAAVTNIAESHVWCSIVSEHLAGLLPLPHKSKHPVVFDDICYPRRTAGRRPASLPTVQAAGLSHLAAETAATSLTPGTQQELMQLVAAATCPDLWHHPAVVRFALQPAVTGGSWPPPHTTTITTPSQLAQLERRWARKNHW